ARFPSIQHVERDGQHIVELTDMRFALRRSSLPAPFTYRVIFDSEGKVIFQGWAME
ncbi:MAG: hypothetical protein HY046_09475, partial [Acidobacteria bacterium]|nr:hypothetical protein [Acidobacteriota bacterium]